MSDFNKARDLLISFKGNDYQFGPGTLKQTGLAAAEVGKKAVFDQQPFPGQ